MLIATHAAAIRDAIAATGRTIEGMTVAAQFGDYGAISVSLTDGAELLADVGPGGVHAWRGRDAGAWCRSSVDTAAEALSAGGVA